MKVRCICIIAIAISIAFPLAPAASAVVIATSKGAGADAEVRDHQPATNLGASTELATRILDNFPAGASDVNDRFSAMYMKFDITGQFDVPNQATSVRLTYRNSNLTPNRVHDPTPPGNNIGLPHRPRVLWTRSRPSGQQLVGSHHYVLKRPGHCQRWQ